VAIIQWPRDYLKLYPGGHPLFVTTVLGTGLLGLGLLGAAVRLTAISRRRGCPVLAVWLIRSPREASTIPRRHRDHRVNLLCLRVVSRALSLAFAGG